MTTGVNSWSVTWVPGGARPAISRSTSGTVDDPPDVLMPKLRALDSPPCASASRANAGVSGMKVGRTSTSSSMISELNDARPTILMFIRSAGGTAFVPNPGKPCCASE